MIDDQLTFSEHIAKTARSSRFALFNIKKIRPFLLEHATQLLVQALVLSRLDYCNAMQFFQTFAINTKHSSKIIYYEPKRMQVTPLFINVHWLPIAARIKFKALMLAYKTTTGTAPLYLNSLI